MELDETIAQISDALDAGVTSTNVDGVQTNLDLDHLERRQRQLKRRYWASRGLVRHPLFSQPVRVSGGES